MDSNDLIIVRTVPAPPHQVFEAWVDAETAAKWLFRTPEAVTVRAEIDPVEGGEFLFVEERADERVTTVGEYLKVEAPRTLHFAFSLDHFRTSNEVHVRLEPSGAGTQLTLTHKLDPQWAAYRERTSKGWNDMLDNLERTLISMS